MLCKSNPNPVVLFACGSASTKSVLNSKTAKLAARLIAVVVFPTPPFWLAIPIILAILIPSMRIFCYYLICVSWLSIPIQFNALVSQNWQRYCLKFNYKLQIDECQVHFQWVGLDIFYYIIEVEPGYQGEIPGLIIISPFLINAGIFFCHN